MNEGFEQFFATIIEQCLGEYDMQPPLVVHTVGDNGSVLVAGFNEGAELVLLTKHCQNDTFTLPIKITGRQPKQQERALRHRARRQYRPVSLIIEVGTAFPHTPLGRWCGSLR